MMPSLVAEVPPSLRLGVLRKSKGLATWRCIYFRRIADFVIKIYTQIYGHQ